MKKPYKPLIYGFVSACIVLFEILPRINISTAAAYGILLGCTVISTVAFAIFCPLVEKEGKPVRAYIIIAAIAAVLPYLFNRFQI